jgi:S1-C subfamily serine protease
MKRPWLMPIAVIGLIVVGGALARSQSMPHVLRNGSDAQTQTPGAQSVSAHRRRSAARTAATFQAIAARPREVRPSYQDNPRITVATVDAVTERAYAAASPSVVYISNVGVDSGSGIIYDGGGSIVTNAHVVAGAQRLRVTLNSGQTYAARLIGVDRADDLAVIHINASGLPAARFAAAGSYRVAQTVLAIGSPLGLQQSVTSGLISALNRTVREPNGTYLPDAIQTSAPINPGNSGGALVTLEGTVVGIPTLEALDPQNNNGGAAQGIGFAVPSPRVIFIAHQLIATGHVAHTGRAYLGLSATDGATAVGPGSAVGGDSTPTAGAIVKQVAPGSPAAQANIRAGDVIAAIDGAAVTGETDLLAALAQARPGAIMALKLSRNGSLRLVRVHLGELSAQ